MSPAAVAGLPAQRPDVILPLSIRVSVLPIKFHPDGPVQPAAVAGLPAHKKRG